MYIELGDLIKIKGIEGFFSVTNFNNDAEVVMFKEIGSDEILGAEFCEVEAVYRKISQVEK